MLPKAMKWNANCNICAESLKENISTFFWENKLEAHYYSLFMLVAIFVFLRLLFIYFYLNWPSVILHYKWELLTGTFLCPVGKINEKIMVVTNTPHPMYYNRNPGFAGVGWSNLFKMYQACRVSTKFSYSLIKGVFRDYKMYGLSLKKPSMSDRWGSHYWQLTDTTAD